MPFSNPDPEAVLAYKVMIPFELSVVVRILAHPHGKSAMVAFHYLQDISKIRNGAKDGWLPVSQDATRGLGLDTQSRRRGLRALEELGLVALRQKGHSAYQAKLLYGCPDARARPATPKRKVEPEQQVHNAPLSDWGELMKARNKRIGPEEASAIAG